MAKKNKKKTTDNGMAQSPAAAEKSDKAAKKAAKAAAKAAKKADKGGKKSKKIAPKPVKTGKGASPLEVGQELVALFNTGKVEEVEKKLWNRKKIRSIEGFGVGLAWEGLDAVGDKNTGWMQDHVMHGARAEGPFVGSTGFAVRYWMDVETKSTGKRETMEEVGVYTIKNGKIVQEEFMYHIPKGA